MFLFSTIKYFKGVKMSRAILIRYVQTYVGQFAGGFQCDGNIFDTRANYSDILKYEMFMNIQFYCTFHKRIEHSI